MAKDTEKLIRQLSLISFLMAERRSVTALEIKQEVEGYSGMNDDAFARRFYADRAELESLGIDLKRDPEALELGAVGVEAAREGVVVHRAVALDLLLDLERRDRPAVGHQKRDQRKLADQLLGVLGHAGSLATRWPPLGGAACEISANGGLCASEAPLRDAVARLS